MKRAMLIVAVLALGASAAGCAGVEPTAAATEAATDGRPGITARGVGTRTSTPDTMTVVLGVATRGASAREALADNSAQATALIEVLTGGGVAAEDLQTSQLSVYPTFDQSGARITGYEVTNQVTATLRDIAAAGGLIDAAAAVAGDAVRVQQFGFSLDEDDAGADAPRAQARAEAVEQAQARAGQLATAAGVRLGGIRSITEVPADAAAPPYPVSARSTADAAVPVQPGSQEVAVTVEIVYGIEQ